MNTATLNVTMIALDDVQLCNYRPGNGSRLVRDMADENAVLFLWVPSPMLKRCFAIIDAWGFDYKTHFVWDKVKHVMGHYNSVRHELLLISTPRLMQARYPEAD